MKKNFRIYEKEIPKTLVELDILIQQYTGKKNVLDYSLSSLDKIESFLVIIFKANLNSKTVNKIMAFTSSYMGEILRKKLNGKWKLCVDKDVYDFGLPMVTDLEGPISKTYGFCPIQDLIRFKEKVLHNINEEGFLKKMVSNLINFKP